MERRCRRLILISTIALVCCWSQPGFGSGFALYEVGARGSALGGAMVGRADDPSAIFYNPAGITQLPGLRVMGGISLIIPNVDVVTGWGPVTTGTHMQDQVFFPPHLYLSYQIPASPLWLGLGVFSPFGLGVEFDSAWPGRINNIKTSISSININPTFAVKITDYLAVGAGLDLMVFNVEMRRVLPLPLLGFQDTTIKAHSLGCGWNAGLLVKPTDYLSFGISYRSQVRQQLKGEATFTPGSLLNADAQGKIILPDMFFAGVMFKLIKPLSVEVGFIYTRWSRFRQLEINFNNVLGPVSEEKNWRDVWRVQLGLEYRAADWLDLRAGYAFDQEPIPDQYADYIVPASDRHYFSFGPGFRWRKWTLDLSYTFMFMADRAINNSRSVGVLPSNYENRYAHILGLSLGYRF
ncbi:MAG: OmpP1/FadL family transporter [Syntrophales bacterium]|nr:OmpP1/FadL family transporter [Syntrophales bacterium]